jgi:hypothetical protein
MADFKLFLLVLLLLAQFIHGNRVCDCRNRVANAVAKITTVINARNAQIAHFESQSVTVEHGLRVVATLPNGMVMHNAKAFAPSLSFPPKTTFTMDSNVVSRKVIQSLDSDWAIVLDSRSYAAASVPSLVSKATITSVPDDMELVLFPEPFFKGMCQRFYGTHLGDVSHIIGSYMYVPLTYVLTANLFTEPDMKGCEVPIGPAVRNTSTILGGIHSLVVFTGAVIIASNDATRIFTTGVYPKIKLYGDVYTVKAVETMGDVTQVCDGELCHDMVTMVTTALPSFQQYTVPVGYGLMVETPFGTIVLVGHGELPYKWCHGRMTCSGTVVQELPADQPLFCKKEWCFYAPPTFSSTLQGITSVKVPNGYTVEIWWNYSSIFGSNVYASGTHVVGIGALPITKFLVIKT